MFYFCTLKDSALRCTTLYFLQQGWKFNRTVNIFDTISENIILDQSFFLYPFYFQLENITEL